MKRKIKFYKENWKTCLLINIILLLLSPIFAFIFLFHPSVSESIYQDYGECNRYYNDIYLPCLTIQEAYFINLKLMIAISFSAWIGMFFNNGGKKCQNISK